MKKHAWKIVAAIVILLIGVSIWYAQQAKKEANEGVTIETHIKGNPDAPTVLVEYSDFECPACAQFYPYVKDVIETHGDSLRFEYRHFPLINIHPFAVPGARAAEAAAQQGKFFEMHDMLFERQNEWAKSTSPIPYFTKYAEELGLDVEMFKRQMDSSIIDDAIMESFNEARGRGFTGTPTFLLNGERMEYETFEDFRVQIEAAIASSTVQ